MGIFNSIKKSRRASSDIDEKIEYLNKELEKTGLREGMNTSGMYFATGQEPNASHNAFKALSNDGQSLGFSGKDYNLFTEPIGGLKYSPPHPVTGQRQVAQSYFGIASDFRPVSANSDREILWVFDQDLSGGAGRYFSMELTRGLSPNYFGVWIDTAFGTSILVPYEGDLSPLSDRIKNNLNNLNVNNFNDPNVFGPENNTIAFKNDLGDPDFLPIDTAKKFIAGLLGLAGEGLEYLKNAAKFYGGLPTAASNMLYHTAVQDPDHPDHRKHDPSSDNYVGPKKVEFNPIEQAQTDSDLHSIISGLNGGKGPKNPKKLSLEEIKALSDGMNAKYKSNPTWYNTFHSLPTHKGADGKPITKVTKNEFGGWDVESNYFFTDDEDASDPFSNAFANTPFWTPRKATVAAAKKNKNHPDANKFKKKSTGEVIGGQFNTQQVYRGKSPLKSTKGLFKSKSFTKESLDESVKLGHFDPEELNVDINDIRKGIMPEFPENPPLEMIDGYAANSKLAPKVLKGEPFIKVTKKDLAALHILKDSEIKELLQQIDLINVYLQNNPADLVYAQQRYPKDDIRLAKLNWKMDQMMQAGKEYMDKHYPENQKLFTKIQKSINKNIKLTDPKSFKGVKIPKFKGVDLTDFKRRKEVVARHYKKVVKTKKLFSRKKT